MRTPGHDFELAAGFLFTEGILQSSAQIHRIRRTQTAGNPRQAGNSVTVELNAGVEIDFERLQRNFYTSSSCGVCGKASIEAIQMQGCPVLPKDSPVVASDVIHRLPSALRHEDIGRHNAVDKVIGAEMMRDHTPLSDKVLLVSGRAGFELVQKALIAGIPVMAAVGAPSSLAVETAQRFQMTLLGFVRDG